MDQRRRTQKGQAIVLIALMMAVLIGFVALAIDSARAFDGRRILQDSVDAAALAAAESYQNGATWSAAQTNAVQLFERDNRLYAGESCAPGIFGTPTPGQLGLAAAVTTTCTMSGGSGYVLTLSATDFGPAGQTFALIATRPLSIALMQVLGQASVTLTASSAATAADAALTPALAGLSQAGCFGSGGPTPLNIPAGTSPYLTVLGDVVSNGAATLGGSAFLHIGGDLLTRCAAPTNAGNVTYECWPSGAPPPCAARDVQGRLRSTTNNFADPTYLPPPAQAAPLPLPVANAVEIPPGLYVSSPFTTPNACYFLAGGVFEWQSGFTLNGGMVSNELRPPAEPTPGSAQFWENIDGSGALPPNHCHGDFAPRTVPVSPVDALPSGTYSVEVTSVRQDFINGVPYNRESAPSSCKTVPIPSASNSAVEIVISNVPGAQTYNVYARADGSCVGLGLVRGQPAPSAGTEFNNNLAHCPDTSQTSPNCSLGQARATYKGNSGLAIDPLTPPPDGLNPAFGATLPGQTPGRASPPRGDLGNENHCLKGGVQASCPTALGDTSGLATPGAVIMNMTGGTCLNLLGGDAYLFSGYQYNWVLNYQPRVTACSANTWQGRNSSAMIGMSYTPGTSFRLSGSSGSQSPYFGGIVAASILVQNAGNLVLNFNPLYAPRPPGTRLTG